MSYRNYSTANGFIVDQNGLGDFTTIQSAITASSSGTTIFIRPGTYTEDLTLSPGISLTQFPSGGRSNTCVTIVGKMSFSSAGTVSIADLTLESDSDNVLEISGSSASSVVLRNCNILIDSTGFLLSSSNSSSSVNIQNCRMDLVGATALLFSITGSGAFVVNFSNLENSGGSTSPSTASSGIIFIENCRLVHSISTSSTAIMQCEDVVFFLNNLGITAITHNATAAGSWLIDCTLRTGNATAISIGTGATLMCDDCLLESDNANITAGLGTLRYVGLSNSLTSGILSTSNLSGRSIYTGGISFDGGTNVLDVYEIGTFMPAFSQTGVAPTTITFSEQSGNYIRIGDFVYATLTVGLSAFTLGPGTGNLLITGLPFTSSTTAGSTTFLGIIQCTALNWDSATFNFLNVRLNPSSSSPLIYQVGDNNTTTPVPLSALTASSFVRISISYIAA